MYPLGLTPRDGVERVLPNHFLDLSDWTLVRRWPTAPLVFDADPVTVQHMVGEVTRRAIAALARDHVLQSPLTAGRDSRALLACARGMADRMTLFTAELPRELVGWRDVTVATAIARRFGLRHVVLRHRRARKTTFARGPFALPERQVNGEAGTRSAPSASWRQISSLSAAGPETSSDRSTGPATRVIEQLRLNSSSRYAESPRRPNCCTAPPVARCASHREACHRPRPVSR